MDEKQSGSVRGGRCFLNVRPGIEKSDQRCSYTVIQNGAEKVVVLGLNVEKLLTSMFIS